MINDCAQDFELFPHAPEIITDSCQLREKLLNVTSFALAVVLL